MHVSVKLPGFVIYSFSADASLERFPEGQRLWQKAEDIILQLNVYQGGEKAFIDL